MLSLVEGKATSPTTTETSPPTNKNGLSMTTPAIRAKTPSATQVTANAVESFDCPCAFGGGKGGALGATGGGATYAGGKVGYIKNLLLDNVDSDVIVFINVHEDKGRRKPVV
jgi:hypothetical protein